MLAKVLLLLLFPAMLQAHPGVALVMDSRGALYYSDLERVWKVEGDKKQIILNNVHSHELYMDRQDNLWGEHVIYTGEATDKFYHYLWRRSSSGQMDTVVTTRQAFVRHDYSLARDKDGNEYFIREFGPGANTRELVIRDARGNERAFATGEFKGVRWLHPQDDGSLLYILENNVYRVRPDGKTKLLAKSIADERPSFAFASNNRMLWGCWQDKSGSVYVAVFSDQAVKKIDAGGNITTVYRSTGNWTPLQGIFDLEGVLWVLETSDKNETRLVRAGETKRVLGATQSNAALLAVAITLFLLAFFLFSEKIKHDSSRTRNGYVP